MPNRILFTLSMAFDPSFGGVQMTTFKLGNYFASNGFNVFFLSLASVGHTKVSVGNLVHPDSHTLTDSASLGSFLLNSFRKIKPDIIINQVPYEKIFRQSLITYKKESNCFLIACLRNSLFAFKSNATDIISRIASQKYKKLFTNKLSIQLAQLNHWVKHRRELKTIINIHDKFILLTPKNEDELAHFLKNYSAEKIEVIPNSIPQVLKEVPTKKKQILHVGNLNISQKRSDLLLPFWIRTLEKIPDWEFVIVGDGEYKATMESLIKEINIPRVKLIGRANPEKYFLESSIFIMPSAYEGFPNVILEAQSYGLVTIAFKSYLSLDWIVNDKKDSLLIRPFDLDAMAETIILLCNNQQLLNDMAINSLHNAKRFTIDNIGPLWLDLFQRHGLSP